MTKTIQLQEETVKRYDDIINDTLDKLDTMYTNYDFKQEKEFWIKYAQDLSFKEYIASKWAFLYHSKMKSLTHYSVIDLNHLFIAETIKEAVIKWFDTHKIDI